MESQFSNLQSKITLSATVADLDVASQFDLLASLMRATGYADALEARFPVEALTDAWQETRRERAAEELAAEDAPSLADALKAAIAVAQPLCAPLGPPLTERVETFAPWVTLAERALEAAGVPFVRPGSGEFVRGRLA